MIKSKNVGNNKVVIEIEKASGGTLCSFILDKDNNTIEQPECCNHADTDNDYLYSSDNELLRIQLNDVVSLV